LVESRVAGTNDIDIKAHLDYFQLCEI